MRIIILFIITSIIISCGSEESSDEKKVKEESGKEEVKKKEKQNKIDELAWKYNVKYKLDTVRFRYSIEYKSVLESGHLLIEVNRNNINDIFLKDSLFYVSIATRGNISQLIFPITEVQSKLFLDRNLFHLLVVDIRDIKKIKFVFSSNSDGEDASVSLKNSTGFSANGKLIEMVSLKRE